MKNEDGDSWAGLKTVSNFDNGDNNSALAMGVMNKELKQFSPSSLLVESLIEQLCKLVEKDPINQKSIYTMICSKLHQMNLIDRSYNMDEFEFMRSHYQKALYNLLKAAKVAKTNHDASSSSTRALYPKRLSLKLDLELRPDTVLEWSRYANEFVQLEFIACGGFGQVFKARHKLDCTVYAVKQILLRYQNADGFLRNLKEVKTLACLNHPNIVAYKAAWLEPLDGISAKKNDIFVIDNSESSEDTEESSDIVFKYSNSKSLDNKETVEQTNSTKDELIVNSGNSGNASNLVVCNFRRNSDDHDWHQLSRDAFKHDYATLFVQMQLCEKNMREWLDNRNRSKSLNGDSGINIEQCLSVYIKILKGIEYIHDKGIVHHDIKPSNIFISEDLRQVQVGDFGLACHFLTHTKVPFISSRHKGRIGTKLYAAPEQINGICDAKSDIYSAGIILLELIRPFQTEMERCKVISQLRRGKISPELTAQWPDLVKVISQTLSLSPNKRPSASELLKTVYDKNKSMKCIIYEKDVLIQRLKDELAAKNEEIVRLKQQISLLSNKES